MKPSPKTVFKKYRKSILLMFFYVFVSIGNMEAQGCDCTNCTGDITPMTTDTYTFNVSGATNNDLSNPSQGVCGIFIDFNANHVWSLVITLTSPSGQVITLIGPYDNFGGTTTFTNWDISFLPCSETVMPDQSPIPYTAQWSNLQNWAFFESYTGSYYPYIGCLEDFNSGPVNGDWTLTVINGFANMNTNTGLLNGFSILFCDDDGTGCGGCDAFAGDLSGVTDIGLCEGEEFTGSIDPFYSFGTEPNNQYSYDYIISQNGVITDYEAEPDFSTFPIGVYEICGLSYLTSDMGNIPQPNGTLSVTDLENLLNTSAPFCGDISDDCFMVEITPIPDSIFIQDGFCEGTTYIYQGNNFTTGGVHYITLPSTSCDTTVELTLNEWMTFEEDVEATICRGDTFFIENNFYTTTGNYSLNLMSVFGCDSIVELDLTVLNPQANIAPPTTIDCINPEIELDGSTSTSGAGVTYLWTTTTGNIIGDINENITEVNAIGEYYLTVTVTQNGVTCSNVDSVTVTSDNNFPTANAGADTMLNCMVTEIVLDGNGSTGGSFSYEWTTTNGNIVQDTFTLNAQIDAAGTYVLNIRNLNNNCLTQDTVEVTINNTLPISDPGNEMQINCNNATVDLDGTGSSVGTAFIYQWTTTDGNILLGENTLTPKVDSAGTYELLVTDTFNHCTAMEMVLVTIDTTPPIANTGNDIVLNCSLPQTEIDATNSSQGSDFSFQWTVVSGAPFINGSTTLTPTVNGAGVYELLVTNDLTGCTSTSQVTVIQDFTLPIIVIEMPIDTVTCLNPIIGIDAGNSSFGTEFEYMWTEVGTGNIVSGANGLFPQINEAGSYELEIEDTQNGCIALDTVDVFSNNTFPSVDAGDDLVINCSQSEVNLEGDGDIGGDFDVMWNALNGNIVSGGTSLSPLVNEAGDYELVITNTSNNCVLTDTMTVTVDTIPPIADAGMNINLDCTLPETQIDGTASSQGINFVYTWTVISGAPLVNGTNSLTPTVNGAGVYELTVVDFSNGCLASDQVTVTQDTGTPSINIEMPLDTITCAVPIITIDAGNSSFGVEFEYMWTEVGTGNIVSGANGLFPQINEAGSYELEIENTLNGCIVLDTVEVFSNNTFPNINAGEDLVIDCNQLQVNLNGDGDMGNGFEVTWNILSGGNIVSGGTSLSPLVNGAGDYELVITNTSNSCTITDTTTVTVDTIPPIANAGDDGTVNCFFPNLELDGSGSSSGDFSYLWSTLNGGNIIDETTLQPTVSAGGDYELLVTNNQNGCTAFDSVMVSENFATPIADAGIDTFISCANPIISLDGNNSAFGTGAIYQWLALNGGNILSGQNTLTPEVDSAGTYQLNIINPSSGCVNIDEVIVTIDDDLPIADAGMPDTITCAAPTLILNGNNSSTGGDFSYEWTTTNGSILNNGNTLTPAIDSAGTYILTVTNDLNGCMTMSNVEIEIDTLLPLVDAGSDTSFTCVSNLLQLDGVADIGNNFTYNWTTNGSGTISNATILNPIIDDEGTYQLEVTNSLNGCVATDEVEVTWDTLAPIADAGMDANLDCDTLVVTLGGNSSQGNNITYDWTFTAGGNILSAVDEDSVTVNSGATYFLTVTNIDNSCTAMDAVIVTQDADLPVANAGMSDTITCAAPTLILNGNNSSTGGDFSYAWTTTNGNILNNGNTLTPEIDSAGTYILTVTNDLNGCMAMSNVEIEIDTLLPLVDAGVDTAFTCVSNLLQLDGVGDVGNNFIYNWTTNGVGTISDATILNPIIDDEGTYQLEVTNNLNGCVATDEVEVVWDTLAPIAIAGQDTTLDCDITTITLGGNSTTGDNIQYLWTTSPGGSITSDPNNATISINTGAIYILTVTNTDNNCSSTDEVEVVQDANLPIAMIGMLDTIECGITEVMLDGTGSSVGNEFTYEWTTIDGNIASDTFTLFPIITQGGTYTLTIKNTDNKCEASASINVIFRNCTPVAMAGADAEINCNQPVITLDGSGSSIGSDYNYEWSTPDGNIISDTFTLSPTVNAQGTYILTVINTLSGIAVKDSVLITESFATPIVVLTANDSLDCNGNNVLVNGLGSSAGPNFSYTWSTIDGDIVSLIGIGAVNVSQPGFYVLEITNDDNGCTAIDSIEVFQDTNVPVANAGSDLELNCNNSQLTLDGSNSSMGNNITYTWTTIDGNIISGENTPTPIIDSAGTYILEVMNNDNGCVNEDFTVITENFVVPIADAGNQDTLNCLTTTLTLDGTQSSMGNEMIYSWTTVDGNILLGENTLTPQIDSAGIYELVVINNLNGCSDTSTVFIDSNFMVPIADAGIDRTIDCGISNIILDGTNSSMGNEMIYSWTTNGGSIVNGMDSNMAEIALGGLYILTVQNIENGCEAIDTTVVTTLNCAPSVTILLPDTLTCTTGEITLDGSGSSDWQTIVYEWTILGTGNITGSTNTAITTVDQPGDYQLMLTDSQNGNTAFGMVTVIIDEELPVANAGLPDTLNCNISQITLDGSASSQGAEFEYEWMTNGGSIVNGIESLTPLVDIDATYELIVTNTENGCTNNSLVTIAIDTIAPIAIAGGTDNLTCVDTLLFLNGFGSSSGNNFTYQWTTNEGNIVNGETTLVPQVSLDGDYELTVLDNHNFCEASAIVEVGIDTIVPIISFAPPAILNCTLTEFTLDATASSMGNNFSQSWQTSDGNIVNGANGLTPLINDCGEYTLTILNFENGCSSMGSTTVSKDTIAPVANAGNTVELTCVDTLLSLDGSASSQGPEFLYQWNTMVGNVVDGVNSISPNINLPGEYELVVTNNNNTCTSSSTVQVTLDVGTPIAIIETPDTLNCAIEEIQIDASNSSNTLNFSYLWSTDNGNIESGENTLTPLVNDGGEFILTITNMENGCTTIETIEVIQDTIVPIANAGMEMTLTCVDTVLTLDGSASSQGNIYNYLWTTNFGNIMSGDSSLNPFVDELGDYEIIVTNHNNQCTATDMVQIFQDTIAPEIEIEVIGGLILTCDVGSVVLDASNSMPLGNVTYAWDTPNGNILSGNNVANPEINLAGEYFLTLTNEGNGCTTTEMVAITDDFEEPIINIIFPDTLTCVNLVINLSGQGSTEGNNIQYTWTTFGGNIISGADELVCMIDAPGDYTLTILDTDNGCSISESITVIENVIAPMADAGGPYEFDCIQLVKTLQATASQGNEFIYQWNTIDGNIVSGGNSLQPIVDAFGVYILTVTNSINGCTITSSALVTEDLDTPQDIEVELTLPLCYGDANGELEVINVIGGEPPYQFALDNQPLSSTSLFSGLAAGSYLISIRDDSGCEFEKMIDLPEPVEVDVDLGEDIFLELGENVTLEAMTNIPNIELDTAIWTATENLDCENCLEQFITPLHTAGYTVFLSNENGCTTSDTIIVYVNNKRRIYIPNAFSPNGDGANDKMIIYGGLGVEEIEKFQIFSRWGELVFDRSNFQPNDASMGWDGIFNGQKMNSGVFVFYAKIKYTNGETEVMKGDLFLK